MKFDMETAEDFANWFEGVDVDLVENISQGTQVLQARLSKVVASSWGR